MSSATDQPTPLDQEQPLETSQLGMQVRAAKIAVATQL
jgi:hypothetical protein